MADTEPRNAPPRPPSGCAWSGGEVVLLIAGMISVFGKTVLPADGTVHCNQTSHMMGPRSRRPVEARR